MTTMTTVAMTTMTTNAVPRFDLILSLFALDPGKLLEKNDPQAVEKVRSYGLFLSSLYERFRIFLI